MEIEGHGPHLLVVSSMAVKTTDGPLIITGEVEGSARLLADNEVGFSRS